VQQNAAAEQEQRQQGDRETPGVVERGEDGGDVACAQLPRDGGVIGIPQHHALREHDALGPARRSAGVQQAHDVFNGARHGDKLIVGRLILEAEEAEPGHAAPKLFGCAPKPPAEDKQTHAVVPDDELELRHGELDIQRDDHQTGTPARKETVQEGHPVFAEQTEAIPRPEGRLVQILGGPRGGATVEFPVGETLARGRVQQRLGFRREAAPLGQEITDNHADLHSPHRP